MEKRQTWNIQNNETMFTVEASNREVIVTPGQTYKYKNLKKTTSICGTEYDIPVGNMIAQLYVSYPANKVLVVNGRDCSTGLEYKPMKMPGWGWVFIALHVVNWFLLIGGALGGAIDAVLIMLTATTAAKQSEKTSVRVLKCAGTYAVATFLEFIVAVYIILPMI